jgi:hypothetical protein
LEHFWLKLIEWRGLDFLVLPWESFGSIQTMGVSKKGVVKIMRWWRGEVSEYLYFTNLYNMNIHEYS